MIAVVALRSRTVSGTAKTPRVIRAASTSGPVNAYRFITHQRPTPRESAIGSLWLVLVGALGLAAIPFS